MFFKKFYKALALFSLTLSVSVYSDSPQEEESAAAEVIQEMETQNPAPTIQETSATPEFDVSKVSEAFGHLIGKNIQALGFKFDIECLVKGLKDAAEGKESPLTEAECVQALSAAQEAAFKQQAKDNLSAAVAFLSKNALREDVCSLEEGKLQYKVEKAGDGLVIEPHFSPLIRYKGKYLNGEVFGASKEDEMISLDETIPGLSKGLIGMKEGEKRTLFIHPDLAYGTNGYLPPNSLLTFEVEVIKVNTPKSQEADSLSTSVQTQSAAEIAVPVEESDTAIR